MRRCRTPNDENGARMSGEAASAPRVRVRCHIASQAVRRLPPIGGQGAVSAPAHFPRLYFRSRPAFYRKARRLTRGLPMTICAAAIARSNDEDVVVGIADRMYTRGRG